MIVVRDEELAQRRWPRAASAAHIAAVATACTATGMHAGALSAPAAGGERELRPQRVACRRCGRTTCCCQPGACLAVATMPTNPQKRYRTCRSGFRKRLGAWARASLDHDGGARTRHRSGAGFRAIAAALARPVSTVRSWLRRVPDAHARWLYERAVDRAVQIDRELLVRPARAPDPARARAEPAGRGGAALPRASRADRPAVGVDRLLRPGPVAGPADPLTSGPVRARPCPTAAVTVPSTRPRLPRPQQRHRGEHAVTSADECRDERLHFQRRLRLQDRRRSTHHPASRLRPAQTPRQEPDHQTRPDPPLPPPAADRGHHRRPADPASRSSHRSSPGSAAPAGDANRPPGPTSTATTRRSLDFRSFWPVATVSGLAAGAGVEDEGVIDALFGGSRLGAEGRG